MTFNTPSQLARAHIPPCPFPNLEQHEKPIPRRGTNRFYEMEQRRIDADNAEFERRQKLRVVETIEPETEEKPEPQEECLSNELGRVNRLITLCCSVMKCHKGDIFSRDKFQDITENRQIVMTVVYTQTDLKFTQVGRKFKRDHSTVMHARDKVFNTPKLKERYEDVLDRVLCLEREMNQNNEDTCTVDDIDFPISVARKIWQEGGGTAEIAQVLNRSEHVVYNNLDRIKRGEL